MKVGQVQLSQDESSLYFKMGAGVKPGTEQSITLNPGDVLFFQRPADQIDFLVESGELSEADGEARKAKIPSFVHFNVSLPKNRG